MQAPSKWNAADLDMQNRPTAAATPPRCTALRTLQLFAATPQFANVKC